MEQDVFRFIPACAGNTLGDECPNSCWAGSSPRVRGTRSRAVSEHERERFIPACAGNTTRQPQPCPSAPVHPRVCGEHAPPNASGPKDKRFIPACAGNTKPVRTSSCSTPVHPRVCGEHLDQRLDHLSEDGSSPRVRGTRARRDQSQTATSVHPRVCGEHVVLLGGGWDIGGSSPRVRGTQQQHEQRCKQIRFIPACAGNTPRMNGTSAESPVHPRVCGEHPSRWRFLDQSNGSSPRVRGTPTSQRVVLLTHRFIPACAGNTPESVCGLESRPVHPRVCGEHAYGLAATEGNAGSSPRVRGTPGDGRTSAQSTRFIPACAGNTWTSSSSRIPAPVHPRVCGEHVAGVGVQHRDHGSSPRVRGTPDDALTDELTRRFIPACAGNT